MSTSIEVAPVAASREIRESPGPLRSLSCTCQTCPVLLTVVPDDQPTSRDTLTKDWSSSSLRSAHSRCVLRTFLYHSSSIRCLAPACSLVRISGTGFSSSTGFWPVGLNFAVNLRQASSPNDPLLFLTIASSSLPMSHNAVCSSSALLDTEHSSDRVTPGRLACLLVAEPIRTLVPLCGTALQTMT